MARQVLSFAGRAARQVPSVRLGGVVDDFHHVAVPVPRQFREYAKVDVSKLVDIQACGTSLVLSQLPQELPGIRRNGQAVESQVR